MSRADPHADQATEAGPLPPPTALPPLLDLGRAGGRGGMLRRRRASRVALVLLAVVLSLSSLRGLTLRGSSGDPDRIAQLAAAKLGHTGFPVDAAGVWAARFTYVYLSFDQGAPDGRRNALTTYVADRVLEHDPQLGWNGKGKQIAYLAYPAGCRVQDDEHAIVVVDAWLSDGSWRRLEVPVKGGRDGRMVVNGPPTYVGVPPKATGDPDAVASVEQDSAAADELKQALPEFLAAYAASNTERLTYYTPPDATLQGLAGTVTFKQFTNLRVPVGGDRRTATVTVTWQTSNGTLAQPYRLTVVHRDRWLIADMQAAATGAR